MANERTDTSGIDMLSAVEIDVIGEIMNISMGAAATAVSAMLDKQVTITTPSLSQSRFGDVDYSEMDPSIMVKINYVEGITGTNVIVFRGRDMQIILNLLMGDEELPPEDAPIEFDEMTMSAACEVMNQMMGSSATALTDVLGRSVNISTPTAHLSEKGKDIIHDLMELNEEEMVAVISFNLMVEDIMDSNFISFLSFPLAREIISSVMQEDMEMEAPQQEEIAEPEAAEAAQDGAGFAGAAGLGGTEPESVPEPMPEPEPAPMAEPAPAPEPMPMSAPEPAPEPMPMPGQAPVPEPVMEPTPMATPPVPEPAPMATPAQAPEPIPVQPSPAPMPPPVQPIAAPPPMQQAAPPGQPMMQQAPMQGQYMAYDQGMDMNAGQRMVNMVNPMMNQLNIRRPQYPDFSEQTKKALADSSNFSLLMGVPLEVSIVIGKTRRKIKDILEFGQGTVLELEKQTGAPAEIIVNGQLLAYGDVIVIGDNFGVRITEIVGTKELMDSLEG